MVHDPISLIENKTYEDSVLVPISNLHAGNNNVNVIINTYGQPIRWKGLIKIDDQQIKLYLFDCYLTSEKKVEVEPFSWNGEYYLVSY